MRNLNKIFCLFACLRLMGGGLDAKASPGKIMIIPKPAEVVELKGYFLFSERVSLVLCSNDTLLRKTAYVFLEQLDSLAGLRLSIPTRPGTRPLMLSLNRTFDSAIGKEGYKLTVRPEGIAINANEAAGIFYGLQTLLQIIPVEKCTQKGRKKEIMIPAVKITDYPRFGYRGLMLDVSRHFFTKEEVKRYIDQMVQYKYNVFHWHLTDDHGWRLEIKSMPRLTQTGAWRVPRTGPWGSFSGSEPGEKPVYGGYYTQNDIREVVQYAADRFVRIVPEIDVPAHSLALIASYPHLSCTGQQYEVSPGTDFYKKEDNALCPGNDSSYIVMDKILGEAAALFPGEYLHIGGDEAYKGFWEKCGKCKALMEKEHLPNSTALQSYFIKRMAGTVASKGKKMIGWDEILEGGALSPDIAVMSRYGATGTRDATGRGHATVVTPWGYAYWDLYQGDPALEPLTYGKGRLRATYHYDILPDSVNKEKVMGGQGCLWTEFVPTFRHAEYMTWPRSFALSEILWSQKDKKNWSDFVGRTEIHFKRLDYQSVNYAKSLYDPYAEASRGKLGELQVTLGCELDDAEIYYTLDETHPDHFSIRYTGGYLKFPKGVARIKAVTYRKGKPLGRILNVTLKELEKRIANQEA